MRISGRRGVIAYGAVGSFANEYGLDGDGVVQRRHAHRAICQAEVRPVDRDLGVQPHLACGGGDHRVKGERPGTAADSQAAGHPDATAGGLYAVNGVGDVRVAGDVEDFGRPQVLIAHLVLRVDRPGSDGEAAGDLAGCGYRAAAGDLAEDAVERTEPPGVPGLQPDLRPGWVQDPGAGERAVLDQRIQR